MGHVRVVDVFNNPFLLRSKKKMPTKVRDTLPYLKFNDAHVKMQVRICIYFGNCELDMGRAHRSQS